MAISDQSPIYRDASLNLLEIINNGDFEAYTSDVVIQEINRASEEKTEALVVVIRNTKLEILENNSEILGLASKYVAARIIPEKYFDDALHIAIASYYELDAIFSWNFEHMVKLKTKKGVVSINALENYKPIEILTPLEVG